MFSCILRLLILQSFTGIFRNIHFLYDAIDLKQSVKGTLKVLEKSLETVLDKVNFIVNLCIFCLPSLPQANSSFAKVSHLLPFRQKTTSKTPPPLDTSAIALVCTFSSNLNHS